GSREVHYRRSTFGTGAWSTFVFVYVRPSLRVLCPSNVPFLWISGGLLIGQSFTASLSVAPPHSAAFRGLGFSDPVFSAGAPPFSLAGLGAPGCSLLASPDAADLLVTDAQGLGSMSLFVPNLPVFITTNLYLQYLVLDQGANPLGVTASNGRHVTI